MVPNHAFYQIELLPVNWYSLRELNPHRLHVRQILYHWVKRILAASCRAWTYLLMTSVHYSLDILHMKACVVLLAHLRGLEPLTSRFVVECSIHWATDVSFTSLMEVHYLVIACLAIAYWLPSKMNSLEGIWTHDLSVISGVLYHWATRLRYLSKITWCIFIIP